MNKPQSHRDTEDPHSTSLTSIIIGYAIEVHRGLGPGLPEPLYERAMCIELGAAGVAFERQKRIPTYYKGHLLGEYRVDLIVEDLVLVEIKSVERSAPLFEAQLLTYMRLMQKRTGLLLNFNSRLLKDGITGLVL